MLKNIYRKIVTEKTRNNIHVFIRKLKGLSFTGLGKECNCCGRHYTQFLSKGHKGNKRKNAVCPNCGSLERTRTLYFYLKKETDIFNQNNKILHFAPELAIKNHLINNSFYIDADINPNFARNIIDITNIPFADNYFDYIICSHVLGHVRDEVKALTEIRRVLAPNGIAILMGLMNLENVKTLELDTVTTAKERLKNYGEPDLERLYGLDFAQRLTQNNLIPTAIDYRLQFSVEQQQKYALGNGEREIIYLCRK